jgi:hypothetical protein
MAYPRIDVGITVVAKPPLSLVERDVSAAQELGLDTVCDWEPPAGPLSLVTVG